MNNSNNNNNNNNQKLTRRIDEKPLWLWLDHNNKKKMKLKWANIQILKKLIIWKMEERSGKKLWRIDVCPCIDGKINMLIFCFDDYENCIRFSDLFTRSREKKKRRTVARQKETTNKRHRDTLVISVKIVTSGTWHLYIVHYDIMTFDESVSYSLLAGCDWVTSVPTQQWNAETKITQTHSTSHNGNHLVV